MSVELLQTINYTGASQDISLPSGTYIFKLWGGRGADGYRGGTKRSNGGGGGYVQGDITFNESVLLKCYVGGGSIPSTNIITAKFNGGGNGCSGYYSGGSGGGATDIRVGTGSVNERLLVAGGGGGGGGSNSGDASGGGSSASYAWGFGQNSIGNGSGGGGGGWYGGSAGGAGRPGGGGSSYIGTITTEQSINFPLISVSNIVSNIGINTSGNGWIEIWGNSFVPILTKKRKFTQII